MILGEWRGDDPADKDIPVEEKALYNVCVNCSSINVRSRQGEIEREKYSPGASPAAAEPLRAGWGNSGEGNVGTAAWDIVDMRGAPLGMNSVAAGLGACMKEDDDKKRNPHSYCTLTQCTTMVLGQITLTYNMYLYSSFWMENNAGCILNK